MGKSLFMYLIILVQICLLKINTINLSAPRVSETEKVVEGPFGMAKIDSPIN